MAKVKGILVAYLLIKCLVCPNDAGMSPIVTTQTGRLRGQAVLATLVPRQPSIEIYQFLGVPYATPPTGQLRFRRTMPITTPWSGIFNATTWADGCTQSPNPNSPDTGNEDCLYLNIWVPKLVLDGVASNHPDQQYVSTFVFIHGGGFQVGTANVPGLTGRFLSAFNNIIVVTIQYRLGSLGFGFQGNDYVPGNMGLWDQQEALRWISANIAAFGGSNQQITLGGEDAGAISASWHMLSPVSRQYFQRAIMQSGSILSPWGRCSSDVALAATNATFLQVCNVPQQSQMQCLVSADNENFPPADRLTSSQVYEPVFLPTVDAGGFLPANPMAMLMNGDFAKIPLLIGANKDEGSMYVAMSKLGTQLLPSFSRPDNSIDDLDIEDYASLMYDRFKQYGGEDRYPVVPNQLVIDAIKMQYWPTAHEGNPKGAEVFKSVSSANGDYAVTCPTYAWANMTSEYVQNVFVYYFTQRRVSEPAPDYMGVTHGSEMPFVFGIPLSTQASRAYTDQERQFSRMIMGYWGNFIKNGDPNARGLRQWPIFDGGLCQQYFELNVAPNSSNGVICGLKERDCQFWNDYLLRMSGRKGQSVGPGTYTVGPLTTLQPNSSLSSRNTGPTVTSSNYIYSRLTPPPQNPVITTPVTPPYYNGYTFSRQNVITNPATLPYDRVPTRNVITNPVTLPYRDYYTLRRQSTFPSVFLRPELVSTTRPRRLTTSLSNITDSHFLVK